MSAREKSKDAMRAALKEADADTLRAALKQDRLNAAHRGDLGGQVQIAEMQVLLEEVVSEATP